MIYLASPYSHSDAAVRQMRYEKAARWAMCFIRQGIPAFAPIPFIHPNLPYLEGVKTDAATWQEFNTGFLCHCSAMYVLMLDGWEHSLGLQQEIKLAKELYIPITYVDENYIA